MPRGVGEFQAVQSLPDAVVALFALVTQLGDAWFVLGVLSLLYWFDGGPTGPGGGIDRRSAAFLIALVLGGFGLSSGLKVLVSLPRPPGAGVPRGTDLLRGTPPIVRTIYENFATADGYGFPSGHAVRSTLAWGGLALVLDAGTRRQRYVTAGTVVALVSLSRVVLGVHYAVDVVAGVAVGLAYLLVGWRLVGPENPARAFSLAVVLAVASVVVGRFARDPVAVFGAAVGARITWAVSGSALLDAAPTRRASAIAAGVGLPVLGGLFVVASALPVPVVAPFVATAVALAGVLGLPLVADQLAKSSL